MEVSTESIQLFGSTHIWTIISLIIIGILLILIPYKFANNQQKILIGKLIGIFMLVEEFLDRSYQILIEHQALKDNLPLHLCGISVLVVAVLLISKNYKLFEIAYFWGISGALISILTPDVEYVFPHFLNITFFLSHALIIIGVLYIIFIFRYRPTIKSYKKSLLYLHIYAFFTGIVNYLLNTNYLFLCHKPAADTPLDFMGPWPWYILSLEVAVIIVWLILYAPYIIKDRIDKSNLG